MIFTEAERNFARDLLARVRIDTTVTGGGVERSSYGDGETRAWHEVARAAEEAGLGIPAFHYAGNLLMTPNRGDPHFGDATWIGSHLDSVPNGGNYDGLAGVVAALLVIKKAKDRKLAKPLVGVGLRGEESAWFGMPYVGSKALFGLLTPADLGRGHLRDPRLVLREAMASCGASVRDIERGERLVPEGGIKEFWELHIEQGPVLETTGVPVGVVTWIRGNTRAPAARMHGKAGHSGTTPHHLRKDAVMQLAELLVELEARRATLHACGKDIVFTCGIAGTVPSKHAITTIADQVDFALDVRSLDDEIVRGFYDYAQAYDVEKSVDWGALVRTPAVQLDFAMTTRASEAATDLGITVTCMPSGAGHDAAIFQGAGVPSGMIFVRNQHGSHNKHEAMDVDDFMLGVETLWASVSS